MIDRFNEIWTSISKNRLRTILTGFSVSWGIFMLIVLLGAGNGLKNGTKKQFAADAVNSISVSAGQTSIEYDGLPPGRRIQFTNEDYLLLQKLQGVDKISARMNRWQGFVVSYKNKSSVFTIRGVHPDHKYVVKTIITKGRYVNDYDVRQKRKVAVIGHKIAQEILGEEDPLGKWVNINGIPFQVVGVYKDEGSENENSTVFLPITSAQLTFKGKSRISQVLFTMDTEDLEFSKSMALKVKNELAEQHHFSPADPRAVFVRNNFENFERIMKSINLIQLFIGVIGFMTIIAGIIGVSNIMIISVQERTKEIGIRKALGAKPMNIISMVVLESLFVTTMFGYIGFVSGIFTLETISKFIPDTAKGFANPTVNFELAVGALGLLIVAGSFAGLFPAIKAARIKPIEALRDE
jgi:putative ABC transport system permease protein